MVAHKQKKINRKPLNKSRILSASILIADRDGIDALSMRNVASLLGVKAMSLYKHIANKDELLDGLIDIVISEIELPDSGLSCNEFMKKRAISARKVFLKHSWAPAVLESRLQFSSIRLNYANEIIGKLRESGYTISKAAHIFMVLDSYIYGFIIQEKNWNLEAKNEMKDFVTEEMQLEMQKYPYIIEMMSLIHGKKNKGKKKMMDLDSEFESGLDAILDAYERMK
ncbi:TetR/AcrR family transcriptional regulator [Leptospira sp. GIMC2001]|uniref:TetR/AcrR family transcriptional regulator n=1 Tax=Leptospira sp. GIMC2001 TaxID=1513297 RepID=UPI00234A598A|nr:TetR/AcrR family transcriptional regulator [Leptospira sp. GIMC2001]WCL50893.1 TetR/AcrR family transcriptional regulator [Leptospira sp. GIMC2001]